MRAALALLAVALAAAPALAQHEHGSGEAMVVIAHDAPPDGRAVVGNVAHFAAILFGPDGAPQFHHNMRIEVRLDGVLLWSTTPDSGHDYDGVNGFDVVFPAPGRYNVTATTMGRDGEATGSFEGFVAAAEGAQRASLRLDAPGEAMAWQPASFQYAVLDAAGEPLPHTDAVFEVRQGGSAGPLEFRVHTHGHDGAQRLDYAFTSPGEHLVTLIAYTAYPTADAPVFPAFVTAKQVMVSPGSPLPASPMPAVPTVNQDLNDVTMGDGPEPYVIMTTYDPYTSTGPFGEARLSTLVVDPASMQPVQHVNFQAALTDALGNVVFRSDSLHEYDGVLEVLAGQQLPGQYHLAVAAEKGAWKGNAQADYTVLPPAAALSAGPQFLELHGLEQAVSGAPAAGELFAHDAAGMPFVHSEVDLQVLPPGGGMAPVIATKLHTHDDGRFPFNLTLAEPGEYVLRLTPFPLEARPTPAFFGPRPGDPLEFHVKVAQGAPLVPGQPLQQHSEPRRAPGPDVLAAGVGLAAAVLLARRAR
jgi:hypothetical protein